jgi:hypothetical protein
LEKLGVVDGREMLRERDRRTGARED